MQDTSEPVFSVKESLKITGAVVLFEGLLGSVEFPELIEKEQSNSIANLNIGSAWQFCISGVKGCSSISATMRFSPNTWCFINAWDSPGFSCVPCLLSLLQEEEESQMVVVDYSRYGAGKNNGGECREGGRADCVGLGAWTKGLGRPCLDSPILRRSGECCSTGVLSLLVVDHVDGSVHCFVCLPGHS